MKFRTPILMIAAMLLVYASVLLSHVLIPPQDPSPLPALDSSRRPRRRPFEAKDPLPAAPEAGPQDLKAVTEAMALVIKAADARPGGCGNIYFGGGRFLIERDMLYREWRLLAQTYPVAAERVAEDLIRKRTSSREWHAAFAMLSELSRRGGRRAEQLLLRNVLSAPSAVDSELALHFLSAADPDRLYQETYRKQWSFGQIWACGLLDHVVDPKAIELLRKISTNPAEPDYLRKDVDMALARLQILEGADLRARLTAILEQPPTREDRVQEIRREEESRWALGIALWRQIDLRAVLRRLLDRNMAAARNDLADVERFAKDYRVNVHVFPRDWDSALVTYVELGGAPNALERDRLREFGYLCDPKERLGELLRALR